MTSINSVTLSGRLTRDSELRSTAGGMSVLGFTVAFNDSRKVNGQWTEVSNYINCSIFGKRAEALADKLLKGVKVCIHARLRFNEWETKTGEKRNQLTAIVDDLDLTEPKKLTKQVSKSVQNFSKPDQKAPNFNDDLPF